MASAPLPFCSSLTTAGRFLQTQNPAKASLCFSGTNPSFLSSLSLHRSTFCPITSSRPALSPVPKFSESKSPVVVEAEPESPVVEAEPEWPGDEPTALVETVGGKPKREEIFAVVMVGGRQYIVFPGRFIYTQRLKGASVNDEITLNKVLLVGTRTRTWIGKPVVPDAVVHAVVEEQGLNPKVIVFKYKKKKNYRRNIGHRQPNTRIRITGITGYQDSPFVTLDS